jgi:hypothetical protein
MAPIRQIVQQLRHQRDALLAQGAHLRGAAMQRLRAVCSQERPPKALQSVGGGSSRGIVFRVERRSASDR